MEKQHKHMTEEEQRIAIAEFCDWKHRLATQESPAYRHGMQLPNSFGPDCCVAFWKEGIDGVYASPPDYLHDLNAIHEAELKLDDGQAMEFERCLRRVCVGKNYRCAISATAAQRAEALLKTIGKWKC